MQTFKLPAIILLVLMSWIACAMGYGVYMDNKAKKRATNTCEHAVSLRDKAAILAYFKATEQTRQKPSEILYNFREETKTAYIDFQGFVFSRHICSIQFENETIKEHEVFFMD